MGMYAARAADEIPIQKPEIADLADNDGGDGVIVAGQAEARPAHQQRGHPAHRPPAKIPSDGGIPACTYSSVAT